MWLFVIVTQKVYPTPKVSAAPKPVSTVSKRPAMVGNGDAQVAELAQQVTKVLSSWNMYLYLGALLAFNIVFDLNCKLIGS